MIDINKAKIFLKNKENKRKKKLIHLYKKASSDFKKIVDLIIKNYNPKKIYQWGSLLSFNSFTEISDIDIALEGLGDIEKFFKLYGEAMRMTSFPVDIIELEKIEPEFRDIIIDNGRLIYERK